MAWKEDKTGIALNTWVWHWIVCLFSVATMGARRWMGVRRNIEGFPGEGIQHVAHRFPQHRVDIFGHDFRQGNKDETAAVHAGMGDDEVGGVDDRVVKKNKVNVDGAGMVETRLERERTRCWLPVALPRPCTGMGAIRISRAVTLVGTSLPHTPQASFDGEGFAENLMGAHRGLHPQGLVKKVQDFGSFIKLPPGGGFEDAGRSNDRADTMPYLLCRLSY